MDSSLKEEIFESNSTTLQTLSKLDVLDIIQVKSSIKEVEEINKQLKQQLDSLGQTVFDNQASNNREFVLINTKFNDFLVDYRENFGSLVKRVDTHDTELSEFSDRIYEINKRINKEFVKWEEQYDLIKNEFKFIDEKINKNTELIKKFQQNINEINKNIENIKIDITNNEYSKQLVVGVSYFLVFETGSRQIITVEDETGIYGRKVEYGNRIRLSGYSNDYVVLYLRNIPYPVQANIPIGCVVDMRSKAQDKTFQVYFVNKL